MSGAKSSRNRVAPWAEVLESRRFFSLPAGGEFAINPNTALHQGSPSVATDANGNYVVAWNFSSDSDGGILAQRFDSSGTALGTPFQVDDDAPQSGSPEIAMNGAGDFVVAWGISSFYGGGSGGVYARQFDATGTPKGSSFQVNSSTTDGQAQVAVAIDNEGDFVVTWARGVQYINDYDVVARRFDATGQPLGDDFLVNTNTTNVNWAPSVGMDGDGDFVIAWQSGSGTTTHETHVRRFDSTGASQGSEFVAFNSTSLQSHWGRVAMRPDGEFVIAAWRDDEALVVQRFGADGNRTGSEFRADEDSAHYFWASPDVAFNANGDFVVWWEERPEWNGYPPPKYEIYARRYNAAAVPQGGQFQVNTFASELGFQASMALEPDGTALGVWQKQLLGIDGSEVRARRIPAGPASSRLTISGTTGNDKISIKVFDTILTATVNGVSADYDVTPYSRIEVLCGDGNDVVKIQGEVGIYVLGGLGNDSLTGGDGNDTLSGAAGNDWILGGGGHDLLSGGKHSDKISGSGGNDTIRGDQSSDSLNGNEGMDCIFGGTGNDTLHGSWDNDSIFGEDGADRIYGEDGFDSIDAGAGDDRVRGGEHDDWITGGAGKDIVYGNEGNDTLYGGDGDDRLMCGTDNNTVYGEGGNDYILGGTDSCADLFHGGSGRDSIEAADGYDVIKLIEFSIQNG